MQNTSHRQYRYAGFWRRLLAFSLDNLLISLISTLVAAAIFGLDYVMQAQQASAMQQIDWNLFLLDLSFPALWTVGFWLAWKATPGKLLLDTQIVDADSMQKASLGQLVLRYLCYILSLLPLGLGFLWIAFSKRKQGWHDKLSHTVVILQDESLSTLESYMRLAHD